MIPIGVTTIAGELYNQYSDEKGEFVMLDNKKWYTLRFDTGLSDYYPDWLDKTLFGILVFMAVLSLALTLYGIEHVK